MVSYYGLIRELTFCFRNKDGSYRVSPKGVWAKRKISKEKYRFICRLLDLNLKTEALREVVKYYILNSGETVKSSADWYNDKYGTNYNYVAIQNAFNYDRNKILAELSLDSLSKLFYDSEDMIDELKIVEKLIFKYSNRIDWGNGTPLDLRCNNISKSISDEEFSDGLQAVAMYSWRNILEVSKGIPDKFKEYLNYLSKEIDLDGIDKERFGVLNGILDVEYKGKKKVSDSIEVKESIHEMII